MFEQVAAIRGDISVSALIRLLVTDEARRLGIVGQHDELNMLLKRVAMQPLNVVATVLGAPSKVEVVRPNNTPCQSEPCQKAIYQKGKYEIVFINGLADWITINKTLAYRFDTSAIEELGLPDERPSFNNPESVIRWQNIDGLREVSIFNNGSDRVAYFYIKCTTE